MMNAGFHHREELIHYMKETRSNTGNLMADEDMQSFHQGG